MADILALDDVRVVLTFIYTGRHIYRHAYRPEAARSERLAKMDALALSLAEEMRVKGWAQELPVAQQIFALMPLRHSPSLDRCVRAHTLAALT